MMKINRLAILILVSLLIVWFCVGVGSGGWQQPSELSPVIWQIRWPRILVAILVGASLSISGAALQALFENPLADPSLIGTSGGAALGVVLVIALGLGSVTVPLAAFIGAFAVCFLILIGHKIVGGGKIGLLVMGFVVSALTGSIVSIILFVSDDMALRSAMAWLAGSFAHAGFISPLYALGIMVSGGVILLAIGRNLDSLLLGENTAVSMGVSVARTRVLTVIGVSMLTGAAVSLGGLIGFIGMIIPNVLTKVMGGGRTKIMFYSAILGALFLLLTDTFARWVVYPIDVPVGLIVAVMGGPFFIWLMVQRRF